MGLEVPIYNTLLKMLTNPAYAGAYAFGKTQSRIRVVEGRARKTAGIASLDPNGLS